MRTKIKEILTQNLENKEVVVKGWIKTIRLQKNFGFIQVNDGSCIQSLQVIVEEKSLKEAQAFTTGSSIAITGTLVASPGKGQSIELKAKDLQLIGFCDATKYPLQKKRHSFEFLRSIGHLRPRSNALAAVARIRNHLAYATHSFFQNKGFVYIHSPIITASDCEGAGKMFQIFVDDPKDHFFGQPAFLTVSGQLNAEIFACALSDVYTFGPTFRAEDSNTSRHLSEFWMIEPEIAFADLQDDIELAESYLKKIFSSLITDCMEDLNFFDQFVSKGVLQRLDNLVNTNFVKMTYTEAIDLLQKSNQSFEYPTNWGVDLQSEHERFICETHVKGPVVVTDYPKDLKSFYMRENDDGTTVAAMDILVPYVGEIIGGSQREERLDHLIKKMDALNMDKEKYLWYLELREYGSVPHAGFGAGFERLVQFATGLENIRDVTAFPRYPGHVKL